MIRLHALSVSCFTFRGLIDKDPFSFFAPLFSKARRFQRVMSSEITPSSPRSVLSSRLCYLVVEPYPTKLFDKAIQRILDMFHAHVNEIPMKLSCRLCVTTYIPSFFQNLWGGTNQAYGCCLEQTFFFPCSNQTFHVCKHFHLFEQCNCCKAHYLQKINNQTGYEYDNCKHLTVHSLTLINMVQNLSFVDQNDDTDSNFSLVAMMISPSQ